MEAWLRQGLPEERFWSITPRVFEIQIEASLAATRRHADQVTTAAWLSAALSRARTMPPLSDLIDGGVPQRTPEEASLELQAQMRVIREQMARDGRIRSWKEWQTGSLDASAPSSG